MKKFSLFSGLVITMLALGCKSTNEKEHMHEAEHEEVHEHTVSVDAIALDNGQKWKVNAEMLPYIQNMENDINTFSGTEVEAYKLLASKLTTNYEALITSCSMTGKSHDELHKWLLPYIESVKQLANAQSNQQAAETLTEIKNHMKIYNTYFN